MWTLTYNGTEKSFADWGLANLKRKLVNQNADTVSFSAEGTNADAAPLFAPESSILIKHVGVIWFAGIVTSVPAHGSAKAERQQYHASGVWWYLENLVFQQNWLEYNGTILSSISKSRLVLGQSASGFKQHSGLQITETLQYAIANGAPLQIGSIGVSAPIPLDEVKDLSCAEVIRRLLRWTPDAVVWFDYSTSPHPTINITRRSAMATATLNAASNELEQIDITPRNDLVRPAVAIYYEKTNQIDDKVWTSTTPDIYPATATGSEFKALVMTISLGGLKANYIRQEIEVADIFEDSEQWWKDHLPELENIPLANITIHSSSRESTEPSELIKGNIASWMNVDAEEDVVRATLSWYDDNEHIVERPVQVRLTATDANSRTYRKLTSRTPEEPTPIGLAQSVYEAVSTLQYEGTVVLMEDEVRATIHPGMKLNLQSLKSEWASMNALVQSVEEQVDAGRTLLRFGPPTHLGPADMVELLRVTRRREPSYKASTRTSGEPDDAPEVEQPTRGRVAGSGSGSGRYKKMTFVNPEFLDRQVVLDAGLLPQTLTVQLREEDVCESGVLKKRYVLCSEPFVPTT